jgi:damage-control phosphatase, subfamily III
MIEISLWGNATDLSLLATLKFEDLERLQGKKAIEAQQKNIVVNDMNEVWKYVETLKDAQIDIVLDNAGIPTPLFA